MWDGSSTQQEGVAEQTKNPAVRKKNTKGHSEEGARPTAQKSVKGSKREKKASGVLRRGRKRHISQTETKCAGDQRGTSESAGQIEGVTSKQRRNLRIQTDKTENRSLMNDLEVEKEKRCETRKTTRYERTGKNTSMKRARSNKKGKDSQVSVW